MGRPRCDDEQMARTETPRGVQAGRALVWPLAPGLLAGALWVDLLDDGDSPVTLAGALTVLSFMTAVLAPYAVGVLLTLRVPRHGAGWAFCGLAAAVAWSAFSDEYARAALGGRPDLPQGELVATLSDSSFVGWFVLLTLCLHYTTGDATPARLRRLPEVTVGSAALFQACALLRDVELAGYDGVTSPWSSPAVAGPASVVGAVAVVLLGLCLLAACYELVAGFRRSRGEARQRLLWLVAGAVPLGPAVVASFAVSYAGYDWVAGPILVACVVTLSLGAALSVLRYRLYDVERVVTDSAAYALSSGAVVAAFGLVVLVITRTVPTGKDSPLSAVLATLAAVGVARPVYLWVRNAVDRRFNRRRFDALRMVERGLEPGGADVEDLLRGALGDPSATLVFASRDGWVAADGRVTEGTPHAVDIVRHGAVTARLRFDPARTDPSVVTAVAATASAEIDNLGLRAELARQVEQVSESRTRLATAHLDERRRMERDLHDGAQQHLLAIALQLQSAQINGDESVLRDEVDRAVAQLGVTVQELRSLANGLQPAALAGGGLRAAVEELAGRVPLRVLVEVEDRRYPPTLESAAWFVVAEGVANAIKHADVDEVRISAARRADQLVVSVDDDGPGGADPRGRGLQGLADRVAALGGRLSVSPAADGGTMLEAVFPCGS
jgi:signal transduction histidine kinase